MEASKRFGKEKIIISLKNVDYIFKHQKELQESVHEILVMNQEILDSVENLTTSSIWLSRTSWIWIN